MKAISTASCGCLLALAALAGAAEQGGYAARPSPPTDGRVGSNYTPAYAVNQVQMWHDFRPDVVKRELAAAKRYYGITMLRVFLHFINFTEDKANFLRNMEAFVRMCAARGIQPGFVFFDDCHRHSDIYLTRPTKPVKGYHNGRWAACPQGRSRNAANEPRFKAYVQEVVGKYARDRRVLFWEVFNEPNMRNDFSRDLVAKGYRWAKARKPLQPVLCCWDDNPHTDVVDAHNYGPARAAWERQAAVNARKGTVFTEAGARWYAGRRQSHAAPCEVLRWLAERRAAGRTAPGVFLCWELTAGNSNCRWVWGTKEGSAEPPIPWCGLLWPDCTPVSLAESEACLRYATGKGRAAFFDDFNPAGATTQPARPRRKGWTYYSSPAAAGGASLSGWFELGAGEKRIAGRTNGRDYVVEAKVMLKRETGNAGLVFRVSDPHKGTDRMRGYYVGFDTKALYLGRMNNDWREIARFDLTKLESAPTLDAWSLLRVAVKGSRIRVWLNRMHGERSKGLRIDHEDKGEPVSAGSVGVRAHGAAAWFDDVVVLPIDSCDEAVLGEWPE